MHLALWHGLGAPLGLSLVTLVGGLSLYGAMRAIRSLGAMLRGPMAWGPARWYDLALAGVKEFAEWQTRLLQSGYLRYYLLMIIAAALGLSGYTLVSRGGFHLPEHGLKDIYFYEFGLAVLMLLAALAAVRSKSRLGAIASLGVVGYGVALVYILFGAPDLAMTQFHVETLTVILLVLVFYHLPKNQDRSSMTHRVRDAIVAIAFGSLMTLLVLVGVAVQFDPPIFDYFAEHSYLDAHGRNVVNVILVDFRGFDTMGEITVLAVAGIGVYSLLKLRLGKEGKG
jgi:multicomponent Na+:H+ antiporter subunit A